jgi:hypothetical protein
MTGRILQRFSWPSPSIRNTAAIMTALAVWAFFLWRGLGTFGPDRDLNNVDFNSDSAIPVLMSNDDRPLTVFSLYYYRADRWGAWPFLVTRFVGHITGYTWTPESLFTVQAIWVFLGAVVFAGLSGSARSAGGAAYLIALCLHGESRYLLFELSQTYAWQTTALLLGWYCARRMFDAHFETANADLPPRRLRWFLLSTGFSFLAVWSSVASTPFLLFLVSLEGVRRVLKAGAERSRKSVLKPYGLTLTAVVAATVVERLQKVAYHRYGLTHYGNDFQAHFRLDTGHLAENLSTMTRELRALSWWPLYLVPVLASLALAATLAYALIRRRRDLVSKLRAAVASDGAIAAMAALGIAALNFTFAVLVDHVRINGYDTRFLTLTNLFGPISGILTIFLLIERSVHTTRFRTYAQPAFAVLVVVLLAVRFPSAPHNPRYELDKATAHAIARKAPGRVLMGSFWETYLFAALQRKDAMMVPVPFQDQVLATPWTPALLRRSDQVIVAFRRDPYGMVRPRAREVRQYGVRLRLLDANWYENKTYVFALYVNEDAP